MIRIIGYLSLALGLLGVMCLFLPAQAPPRVANQIRFVKPAEPLAPAGVDGGFNPLALTGPMAPVAGQPQAMPDGAVIAALNELRGAMLPTADPAIKQRLTKLLGELFDIRQQVQQQELKALEDRLQMLKDQLDARSKQREAILGKQVEALLAGKEPEVALWVPADMTGGGSIGWGSASKLTTTPAPATGTPPAPKATPAGMSMGGMGMAGGGSGMMAPASDTIRIGLPDELLGQLLQAKTDREKALIGTAIETRMSILETQIKAAELFTLKQVELQKAGLIPEGSAEQAKARLDQLKVLLQAHAQLREQARR